MRAYGRIFKKGSFLERTFGKRCDSRKLKTPMPQ